MSPLPLTELENCVLGVIGRDGPSTRYEVMRVFARSQTTRWSSTAGSIYPVLARMLERSLIEEFPARAGRKAMRITITERGRATLTDWLQGTPDWLGSAIDDPIRTRSFFLAALPAERRGAVIRDWREATRRELQRVAERGAELASGRDPYEARAHDGIRRQLAARLEWLEQCFD